MPVFQVEAPDGSILDIEAPDGATEQQIQRFAAQQFLTQQPEPQQAPVASPAQAPKRSWGEAATDIGASLVSGVGSLAQLPGQVGQLAGFYGPGEQDTGLQGIGKRLEKFGEESKSEALKQKEQIRAQKIAQQEGVGAEAWTAIKETITDPALFTSFLAQQIPNLFGSMGGGMLTKGAVKLALRETTEAALQGAAVKGAVGTGAAMQGADVGSDTYEQTYTRLVKEGVDSTQANEMALGAARKAAAEAAAISIGTAYLPGGTTIERALVGRGLPKTGGFIKGMAGEALAEGIEEGGGKFVSNLAQQGIFPDVDLMKGVGEAAGMGSLFGGMFGGAGSMLTKGNLPQQEAPELKVPEGFVPPPPAAGPQITPETGAEAPIAGEQPVYEATPYAELVKRRNERLEAELRQRQDEQIAARRSAAPQPVETLEERLAGQQLPKTFTIEDIASVGDLKTSKNWFEKNVVGKTQPEIISMVESKPSLIAGNSPRAQVLRGLMASPVEGTGQEELSPNARLQQAAAIGAAKQAQAFDSTSIIAEEDQIIAAIESAARDVEQNNGVATAAQAQLLDQYFPGQRMYDRVEGQKPATEIKFAKEERAAIDLIDALDQGGIPLNPKKLRSVTEGLGLEVKRSAKPEDTIQRIREAVDQIKLNAQPSPIITERAPRESIRFGDEDLQAQNQEGFDRLQANRQQRQAEAQEAVKEQPAPPSANSVIEAFQTPPALRSAAQRIAVNSAKNTYSPSDLDILQTAAQSPFLLDAQQKIRLDAMKTPRKGEKLKAREERISPEKQEAIEKIRRQLLPVLNKFGLKNVGLRLLDSINNGTADGAYFNNIIEIAMDQENPMGTLRHESIHALKKLGAFSDREWSVLTKKAHEQWIDQYFSPDMQRRYLEQYMADNNGSQEGFAEYMAEEGIAEAFRNFDATKPPAGTVGGLFNRIKKFFEAIKKFFTANGIDYENLFSPEAIFQGIEQGAYAPMYGGAEVAPAYKAKQRFAKKDLNTREAVIEDGINRILAAYEKHGANYNGVMSEAGRGWAAIDRIEDGILSRLESLGDKNAYNTYATQIRDEAIQLYRDSAEAKPRFAKRYAQEGTKLGTQQRANDEVQHLTDGEYSVTTTPQRGVYGLYNNYTKTEEFAGSIKQVMDRVGAMVAADPDRFAPFKQYSMREEKKEYPANAAKTNNWKATPFAKQMAKKFEEETGELPYLSAGRADIPTNQMVRYAIKKTGKYVSDTTLGTDAQGNHPILGIPVNKNGTVTLYVPATNAIARKILQEKKLVGATPESNRIYLTNESAGQNVMAERGNIDTPMDGANVMVHVDPSLLQLDREWDNGRKDFFIPLAEGESFFNKMRMTKLFTLDAPRSRALSQDTKFTDLERRVQDAIDVYESADSKSKAAMKKEAKAVLKKMHNISTLLSENGKLEKTRVGDYGLTYDGRSVASMGLGLASAQKINEKNLSTCPKSAICEGLCLGETSGQNELYGGKGQFRQGPRLSQYLKTEAFVQNPEAFAIILRAEVEALQKWANKNDYQGAVRLNVTSDFPPNVFKGIINSFPDMMFYDYTKLPTNSIAPNHHLTYSSTGVSQTVGGKTVYNQHSNWDNMVKRMNNGFNVAMAFTDRNNMPKFVVDEKTGQKFQVWDGDNYDARFLDPKREDGIGMIVGLTNKDRTTKPEDAAAKYNGFFVDYDPKRDGDTVVIQDQSKFAEGKKVIPIAQAKYSLRNNKLNNPVEYNKALEGFVNYYGNEETAKEQLDYYKRDVDRLINNGGKIYRAIYARSPADINRKQPGKHWTTSDANFDDFFESGTFYDAYGKGKKPYVIEATVPPNSISNEGVDISGNPNESEVNLLPDAKATFKVYEYNDGRVGRRLYSLRKAEELAPTVQRNENFKRWFGNSKVVTQDGKPKVMYHGTARDITEFNPKQANAIFVTDDPTFAEDFSELSSDYMVAEYYDSLPEEERRKLVNAAVRSLVKEESITKQSGKELLEKYKTDISGAYRPLRMIIEPMIRDRLVSNANIMPVYVRAENPFDYENPSHLKKVGMQMAFDAQDRGGDANPVAWAEWFADRAGSGSWEEIEKDAVQEAIRNSGFDSFYISEGGRKNLGVYNPNQIKSAIGNVGTYGTSGDIRYSFNGKSLDTLTQLGEDKNAGKVVSDTVKEVTNNIKSADWRTQQRVAFIDASAGLTKTLRELPVFDQDGKLRADYLKHAQWQQINLIRTGMLTGIPVVNNDGSIVIKESTNNLARAETLANMLDTNSIAVKNGMSGKMLVGEIARILRGKDILEEDAYLRKLGDKQLRDAKAMFKAARQQVEDGTISAKDYRKTLKVIADLRKKGYKNRKMNREKLVSPEHIAYAEHVYNTVPEVREILDIFREVNHGLVDVWEQTGLLTKEKADEYRSNKHYVPFFKSAEDLDERSVFEFRGGAGAKSTPKMHELEGGKHKVNIWENINRQYARMTALAYENQTRSTAAAQLTQLGAAEEITNLSDSRINLKFKRDGKDVGVYAHNPLDVAAFQSMSYQMNPVMKAFGAATKALRWGALLNPMFWVKQLIRDPIHASMVTDIMVTPLHATKEFMNLVFGRDREVINILSSHGAIGEFGNTMTVQEYIDTVGKETGAKKGYAKHWWEKLKHIHEASDAATRIAIYKKAFEKAKRDGMSDQKAQDFAVFKARESINFAVQGNSPMMANLRQMIPFLSAQITSLDTVYRAMTGAGLNPKEAAAIKRVFITRASVMFATTVAYAMMYAGDDDYNDVPDYEKDGNWLIPNPFSDRPDGRKSFIAIPVPFEIGFMFKTLPEAMIRYANDDSTGKEMVSSIWRGIQHSLPAGGVPIPQAASPVLEAVTNHSFFTGHQIEGMGELRKPVELRGAQKSSEFAKALSAAGLNEIGLSPVKIDHITKGYFAEFGTLFNGITNRMADAATGNIRPSLNPEEMYFLSSFTTDPNVSRSISTFYELERNATEAYGQFNELKRTGKFAEVESMLEDQEKLRVMASRKPLDKFSDIMAKLNKAISQVQESTEYTADQKRDMINAYKVQKAELAQRAVALAKDLGVR